MQIVQNRRRFLAGLTTVGAAAFVGARTASSEEAPLETTTVRFTKSPGICIAPQYVAEDLIRAEGFTDFQYVDATAGLASTAMLSRGEVDFLVDFGTAFVISIDGGAPIKVLAGVHVGCYELFAHEDIKSVLDLKGKSVGVGQNLGSDPHVFVSAMTTNVGLDPVKDINWVTSEDNSMKLFAEGKIEAFLSFPPEAQELRARKIGHVIVNSITDRPWSQYYCCMLASNAAYAEKYPAATKRVVRAILKAADICVSNPERVARLLVDGGYTEQYDYARQALMEIPYAKWREYDPEDTIRFFSLRLHEAGMVKSSPQKIIANGTDWRFFNEIKLELKA
ncbi:MAG: ABC transporter substrate-binding protein [Mesorhizobium sp.]|uniref:ABC transporter substrate-binding protein n=1 Tax=Mesorhizobium sp. TaxID=1871066 RepID=UPI000FE85E3F|nr:ABC transporter substrate-binding protein [Mesorhizobium sp.]RWH78859.1 MAG: ABC transporter substrate-binding protein [Mesorhizobium sp.]RWH81469.1 MAG: ABC transporter substrate-binding protein [Mesorhizobium sp.]RWH90297.1 MAG: ABC transporter substrate-binding protein [Mesorhizobium sp.]RWH97808.1 MAG: ABC transporter substrate-binding protein [Mesorhizobium sp.]RWI00320.1 MAG: ABC transporter substrate-binding protein [Mesorhizobium sp.]